jgi:hypothetical protein
VSPGRWATCPSGRGREALAPRGRAGAAAVPAPESAPAEALSAVEDAAAPAPSKLVREVDRETAALADRAPAGIAPQPAPREPSRLLYLLIVAAVVIAILYWSLRS